MIGVNVDGERDVLSTCQVVAETQDSPLLRTKA
jgi:hypothetical protein